MNKGEMNMEEMNKGEMEMEKNYIIIYESVENIGTEKVKYYELNTKEFTTLEEAENEFDKFERHEEEECGGAHRTFTNIATLYKIINEDELEQLDTK